MASSLLRQRKKSKGVSIPVVEGNKDQDAYADDCSSAPSGKQEESRVSTGQKEIKDKNGSSMKENTIVMPTAASTTSWFVTKWVILKMTGLMYFIAFLGAYYQNEGLMGSQGLQPAHPHWQALRQQQSTINQEHSTFFSSSWQGFQSHPSAFWFLPESWLSSSSSMDTCLQTIYITGMLLSLRVIISSSFHSKSKLIVIVVWGLLWLLYFTVVTSAEATSFYAYGWESQLLETGFLALFLAVGTCDQQWWWMSSPFTPAPSSKKSSTVSQSPSPIMLWLFRWLCFRISIGAGLIKIRGDSCWTSKTCLYYHFETQPIPSPMSFLFHFLPKPMLRSAVDLDLLVQVYTSWMVLIPTHIPTCPRLSQTCLWMVRIGGMIQTGFMINIIISGNFAFLNHLTIIPALACLDDWCWPTWLQRKIVPPTRMRSASPPKIPFRLVSDLFILWTIGSLSMPVVENLLQLGGKRQQMNASFGSFRLVNTYGAFGSVGQARYEPIVSVSYDRKEWIELEFPCKPGSVTRRPCFCAPYHYRIDWNIWFIGFKPHQRMLRGRESWLFALLGKLLSRTPDRHPPWLDLLDQSSRLLLQERMEKSDGIPLLAKVDMYHYRMAAPLWEIVPQYWHNGTTTVWWDRTFEEVLIPEVEFVDGRLAPHAHQG